MKIEKITAEELRRVLDYDCETGDFTWLVNVGYKVKAGAKAGYVHRGSGYLIIGIHGVSYRAHRLVWLYVKGVWPLAQIDHINHRKTDNRLVNLRAVSDLENHRNQSLYKNNKSNQTGVYWREARGKWQAEIRVKGKTIYLGLFTDRTDAITARQAANIKYKFHENHGKPKEEVIKDA